MFLVHNTRGLERGTDALGDLAGALQTPRDDRDKLLASVPADEVVSACTRAHHLPEKTQHAVAEGMAKATINRLEVIEIEHQHGNGLFALGLPRAKVGSAIHESAAVKQTRQMVGTGRRSVNMDVVILHHQHHDERGADRVNNRLKGKYG